jgi:hypothetical protein
MTRNDDIERVLQQWFTEGPRHMSDRLFDGTLDRIDRLPRGRLADLQSRLPAMYLNVRLVAAAMVLVAVAGAGLVLLNRMPGVGSRPVPTPSPSATVDPSPVNRYVAPGFRPFGFGTTGTFSATVPLDDVRRVAPGSATTDLQLVNPFGPEGSSWIFIVSGIQPSSDRSLPACIPAWTGAERTPTALAAWLGTFTAIEVSRPQPVTIGGLPGVVVDITERPDASKVCGVYRLSDGPRIQLLGGGSSLYGASKLRLILLDRGDGESILIDVGTRYEPTWASVDAAMSIVNGFEFRR